MVITSDTRLDAVNSILEAIGESPVGTLENPTNVDVINAIRMLDSVSRKIQAEGWSFNTFESFKLNPDATDGKIRWNSDILFFKSSSGKIAKRGDYLYDMANQTDLFTEPVTAKVILIVDFEDIPDPIRHFIAARTAKEFQLKYLGDESLTEELARIELMAFQAVIDYRLDVEEPNMFQNPSIQEIMSR